MMKQFGKYPEIRLAKVENGLLNLSARHNTRRSSKGAPAAVRRRLRTGMPARGTWSGTSPMRKENLGPLEDVFVCRMEM
ncbi:hypothetical protein FQR65_LT19082 [Abscondita terminalis]|nr:hypothetical protein FQR65_LT19082 [Abscondita terminalis]